MKVSIKRGNSQNNTINAKFQNIEQVEEYIDIITTKASFNLDEVDEDMQVESI